MDKCEFSTESLGSHHAYNLDGICINCGEEAPLKTASSQKSIEYKVLYGQYGIELAEIVNRHLKEGWVLQGGVCFSHSPRTNVSDVLVQAVVKYPTI